MEPEKDDNINIISSSNSVQEVCSRLLKKYFSKNKNRKGKLVSDTQLSYTHISKLESGDFVKKPYFDTIALIFGKYILSREEFKTLSTKYYPDIQNVVDFYSHFPQPLDDHEDIKKLIRDKVGSIIFQLINTREGTTRGIIRERYHQNGENILNKFLETKFFREINGFIKPVYENTSTLDQETISRLVVNTIEYSPVDEWMTKLAHIFNLSESINFEGFERGSEILTECAIKLRDEVLFNPKYKGSIAVSFNMTSQMLNNEEK